MLLTLCFCVLDLQKKKSFAVGTFLSVRVLNMAFEGDSLSSGPSPHSLTICLRLAEEDGAGPRMV